MSGARTRDLKSVWEHIYGTHDKGEPRAKSSKYMCLFSGFRPLQGAQKLREPNTARLEDVRSEFLLWPGEAGRAAA